MHICFLDIDGTLVATGGAGQTAFVRTLAEDFGIVDASAAGVPFAGRSDRAIALDLFAAHGLDTTPESWERFRTGYVRRIDEFIPTHNGRVLPGVVALLEALALRGDVALGLITGNVHEAARRKLSYFDLWHWFPFGGFGDDHTDRCDIAAAGLNAARRHLNGSAPQALGNTVLGNIVVIGDTLNDITCGRSIGARCVAVPTGQTTLEVLRTGNPDLLVETLDDAASVMRLFD